MLMFDRCHRVADSLRFLRRRRDRGVVEPGARADRRNVPRRRSREGRARELAARAGGGRGALLLMSASTHYFKRIRAFFGAMRGSSRPPARPTQLPGIRRQKFLLRSKIARRMLDLAPAA